MPARKGGVDEIVALFELYEPKIYHIAYAILHDAYQAEDAVMDAFVRLLERRYPIGDPTSDAAKRLIIRTIRSASIDLYRKNKRERARMVMSEEDSGWQAAVSEQPNSGFGDNIEDMIRGLPDIYRSVLRERFVREQSVAETAKALGVSEAVVRKRQERALRMLRKKRQKEE